MSTCPRCGHEAHEEHGGTCPVERKVGWATAYCACGHPDPAKPSDDAVIYPG